MSPLASEHKVSKGNRHLLQNQWWIDLPVNDDYVDTLDGHLENLDSEITYVQKTTIVVTNAPKGGTKCWLWFEKFHTLKEKLKQ